MQIPLEAGASTQEVREAVKKFEVMKHFRNSMVGRRNECIKRKEELNDFGRFKLYYIRGNFKKLVAGELMKLRSVAAGVPVKQLNNKRVRREATHNTVTKVTGKFKRVLVATRKRKDKHKRKRLAKMHGRIAVLKKNAHKKAKQGGRM